jgi:NADPH-dependent glutamate synthase beta subunit-like oxidoreductase
MNIYSNTIVIGGGFTSMDIVSRNGLASYNTSTGVISS